MAEPEDVSLWGRIFGWEPAWQWPPWNYTTPTDVAPYLTSEKWLDVAKDLNTYLTRDVVRVYLRTRTVVDPKTGLRVPKMVEEDDPDHPGRKRLVPDVVPEPEPFLLVDNLATPRNMDPLIRYLAQITDEIRDRLHLLEEECGKVRPFWQEDLEGIGAGFLTGLAGGALHDVLQDGQCEVYWSTLQSAERDWQEKLAELLLYHQAAIRFGDPDASGVENPLYWKHVTLPLLLGLPALTPEEEAQWRKTGIDPKKQEAPYIGQALTLLLLTGYNEQLAKQNIERLMKDFVAPVQRAGQELLVPLLIAGIVVAGVYGLKEGYR